MKTDIDISGHEGDSLAWMIQTLQDATMEASPRQKSVSLRFDRTALAAWVGAARWQLAALQPREFPPLTYSCDNLDPIRDLLAVAENMLLHGGPTMSEADRAGREKTLAFARKWLRLNTRAPGAGDHLAAQWTHEIEYLSAQRKQKTGMSSIHDAQGKFVCKVETKFAPLITAAPDLLNIAEEARGFFPLGSSGSSILADWLSRADAVIEKAKA